MYHKPYRNSQNLDTVKVAVYEAQETLSAQHNDMLLATAALLALGAWVAFAGF